LISIAFSQWIASFSAASQLSSLSFLRAFCAIFCRPAAFHAALYERAARQQRHMPRSIVFGSHFICFSKFSPFSAAAAFGNSVFGARDVFFMRYTMFQPYFAASFTEDNSQLAD